ncbi:MAG: acyl-CoA thioesterase [Cyclobacteriaceae bacterium]|nr:acyl-CoA thioesterase [Cyclobacteriaceae bacterium]
MYQYEVQLRVRYAETDQMGFVYYGNYATYYEVARVEALRSLGITYKSLEARGILLPVLENRSKFILPARYDDLLTIKVTLDKLPSTRLYFQYQVFNEEEKLINLGETTLVFISRDTEKPIMAPDFLIDILNPFFNDR